MLDTQRRRNLKRWMERRGEARCVPANSKKRTERDSGKLRGGTCSCDENADGEVDCTEKRRSVYTHCLSVEAGRVSTKGEWVRLVNTSKTSCARNVDTM